MNSPAASGQSSPDVTVPTRNGLGEAHIDLVDYSSALSVVVSLSPPLSNAVPALTDCDTVSQVLGITKPPTRSPNSSLSMASPV